MTHPSCEDMRPLVPLWLDGELPGPEGDDVEAHVKTCATCTQEAQGATSIRRALMRGNLDVKAPRGLRERINTCARAERRRGQGRKIRRTCAAAAIAIVGAFGLLNQPDTDMSLEHVMRRHAGNLKMDVEGPDPGTVQKYLNRRLPFSVRLPAMQQKSTRLGARVIQFNNRDAAYVRYETSQGRLSVVVFPDHNAEPPPRRKAPIVRRMRGYSVARWRDAGLVYAIVTDRPEAVQTTLQRYLRTP